MNLKDEDVVSAVALVVDTGEDSRRGPGEDSSAHGADDAPPRTGEDAPSPSELAPQPLSVPAACKSSPTGPNLAAGLRSSRDHRPKKVRCIAAQRAPPRSALVLPSPPPPWRPPSARRPSARATPSHARLCWRRRALPHAPPPRPVRGGECTGAKKTRSDDVRRAHGSGDGRPAPESVLQPPTPRPEQPRPRSPRCSPPPAPSTELTPEPANIALVRDAVLCLINQERADHGEQPLRTNAELQAAAESHSDECVDWTTSPTSPRPARRPSNGSRTPATSPPRRRLRPRREPRLGHLRPLDPEVDRGRLDRLAAPPREHPRIPVHRNRDRRHPPSPPPAAKAPPARPTPRSSGSSSPDGPRGRLALRPGRTLRRARREHSRVARFR